MDDHDADPFDPNLDDLNMELHHPPAHANDAAADEYDEDDENNRDAANNYFLPDGSLDGGIAHPLEDPERPHLLQRMSTSCDLTLYLECTESLDDIAPDHSVLSPGVTVAIGLDKLTKLSAVFTRYVEVCNDHCGPDATHKIELADLEFVHCQLLKQDDTAEASALMKNDRIRVRRNREQERSYETDRNRFQRESDREYFKRLRQLVPDAGGLTWTADVVLDCRGKQVDESGRSQEVLRSTLRVHSAILERRCKSFLGPRIMAARRDQSRNRPKHNHAHHNNNENDDDDLPPRLKSSRHKTQSSSGTNNVQPERSEAKLVALKSKSDDASTNEDDEIGVLHLPMGRNQRPAQILDRGGAAEIENDDDDDDDDGSPFDVIPRYQPIVQEVEEGTAVSPVPSSSPTGMEHEVWVVIPEYSPQAMRILLEYCYTNRVTSLGQEAFLQASPPKTDSKNRGPVPPFSTSSSATRRWPNNGLPQMSFAVALEAIVLAEEANKPRLSLMCEVAASQLISNVQNVVDALCLCTTQLSRSANPLSRLRIAAMEFVFRGGVKGVASLARTPSFRRALEEKSEALVPSLISGTAEAVTTLGKRKRDGTFGTALTGLAAITDTTAIYFQRVDQEEARKRALERRKRRRIRWEEDSDQSCNSGDEVCDYYEDDEPPRDPRDLVYRRTMDWALAEATIRSMKRLTGSSGGRGTVLASDSLAATLSRFGYGSTGSAPPNRLPRAFDRASGTSRRNQQM